MNNERRILLGSALLMVVALAVLGRDFVASTIAPALLYAFWSLYVRAAAVPQQVYWGVFLGLLLVIGLRSLLDGDFRSAGRESRPAPLPPGRVRELAGQLAAMEDSAYFKQRVLRHLSDLTLDSLGHRTRLAPDEARALIAGGQVAIDDDLLDYLEQGWQRNQRRIDLMKKKRSRLQDLWAQLRPPQTAGSWEDPQMDRLIAFLEQELEVKQGDN